MNIITIFCCYVLLPYFASLVSPPQESITCYAKWPKCLSFRTTKIQKEEVPLEEIPVDQKPHTYIEPLYYQYFDQNVDHFDFANLHTFQQRYLINDDHYDGNGVIFIQIGTDDDITSWNMQNGLWSEYCRAAKALCIGLERRGYGKSLPYDNLSTYHLEFTNSDQVLADVARFIYTFRDTYRHSKSNLPEKLTWVAYGYGRQGTLAAWLRMKYPHLVHATLSLSAPMLAKGDYDDYFKLIESDALNEENNFKQELSSAYSEIQSQINEKKFNELGNLFKNTCPKVPMSKFLNPNLLQDGTFGSFCDKNSLGDIQNGEKNTKFMYFLFAHTVGTLMKYGNDVMMYMKRKAIDIMLATTETYKILGSPINRFAYLIKLMVKYFDKRCLQINYNAAMNGYRTIDDRYKDLDYLLPQIFGNRTRLFQSCFELGQFQTFDNFFHTSIDLTFYMNICQTVFGDHLRYSKAMLNRVVHRTNIYYGGLSILVSHVIFVYGSYDPYRKLAMIDHLPEKCVVHLLEGTGFCYELNKVKGLKQFKQGILVELLDWLKENNGNNLGDHLNSDDSKRYEMDEKTKI